MIVELKCKHCGKPFKAYECSKRLYCSKTCAITENWKKRKRAPKVKFTCRNCVKNLSSTPPRQELSATRYIIARLNVETRRVRLAS